MVIFEPGILTISIAVGLTGRTYMARIVRGKMLHLRDQEFTLALSGSWQVPPRMEAPHTQLPRAHNNLRDVHHTRCDLRRVVPQLYRASIQIPQASLGSLISDGTKYMQFHPDLLGSQPRS